MALFPLALLALARTAGGDSGGGSTRGTWCDGCTSWLDDPFARILPTTLPPPPSHLHLLVLAASKSQTVSAQLCMRNPGSTDTVGAQLELVGLPSCFRWEARLVGWVNTTSLDNLPAGQFPDPLPAIPRTGATLAAASTTAFWVDIAVPECASARMYPFSLRFVQGGTSTAAALRVFNFSVAQQTLRTDSSVNSLDANHWPTIEREYFPGRIREEVAKVWYGALTAARVNVMALQGVEPAIQLGADGHTLNTSGWDEMARWLTQERGVQELTFPMPVGARFSLTGGAKNGQRAFGKIIEWTHCILPNATWTAGTLSPRLPVFDETKSRWHSPAVVVLHPPFVKQYSAMLRAVAKHVASVGLAEVAVSLSIKDEPDYVDSFTMQALLALVKLSKQAAPSLQIRQTRWPTHQYDSSAAKINASAVNELKGLVSTWVAHVKQFTDPSENVPLEMAAERKRGKRITVYDNSVPVINLAPQRTALFPWMLWRTNSGNWSGVPAGAGLQGSLSWYCDDCYGPDPYAQPANPKERLWPGNMFLLYPPRPRQGDIQNTSKPLALTPSIRWLLFRNGLAEAESFFVLQRAVERLQRKSPLLATAQDKGLQQALQSAAAALAAVASCVWGLPIDEPDPKTKLRVWNHPFSTNTTQLREVVYNVGQAIEDIQAASDDDAGEAACSRVTTCVTSQCPAGYGNLSAGVLIPLGPHSQRAGPGLTQWQASALRASKLFLSLGNASRTGDPYVEVADTLHTTLLYLCCLTQSEIDAALSLMESRKWPLLTGLRFDRAVCVKGSQSNIVVTYHPDSEAKLQAYAATVEQELRTHGVPIVMPRSSQVYFHSTLVQGEWRP